MGSSALYTFITPAVHMDQCRLWLIPAWVQKWGTRCDPKSSAVSGSPSPSCEVILQPVMENTSLLVLQGSPNLAMVTMRTEAAWVIEIHRKSPSSFLADGFISCPSTLFTRAASHGARRADLDFIPRSLSPLQLAFGRKESIRGGWQDR